MKRKNYNTPNVEWSHLQMEGMLCGSNMPNPSPGTQNSEPNATTAPQRRVF